MCVTPPCFSLLYYYNEFDCNLSKFSGRKDYPVVSTPELLNLLIKGIDEVKEKLDGIKNQLRDVEKAIAESRGRHSGLVTAKDIFM